MAPMPTRSLAPGWPPARNDAGGNQVGGGNAAGEEGGAVLENLSS